MTPAVPGCVTLRKEAGVGWITLDQPRRHNAMSLAMWEGLHGPAREGGRREAAPKP